MCRRTWESRPRCWRERVTQFKVYLLLLLNIVVKKNTIFQWFSVDLERCLWLLFVFAFLFGELQVFTRRELQSCGAVTHFCFHWNVPRFDKFPFVRANNIALPGFAFHQFVMIIRPQEILFSSKTGNNDKYDMCNIFSSFIIWLQHYVQWKTHRLCSLTREWIGSPAWRNSYWKKTP